MRSMGQCCFEYVPVRCVVKGIVFGLVFLKLGFASATYRAYVKDKRGLFQSYVL